MTAGNVHKGVPQASCAAAGEKKTCSYLHTRLHTSLHTTLQVANTQLQAENMQLKRHLVQHDPLAFVSAPVSSDPPRFEQLCTQPPSLEAASAIMTAGQTNAQARRGIMYD